MATIHHNLSLELKKKWFGSFLNALYVSKYTFRQSKNSIHPNDWIFYNWKCLTCLYWKTKTFTIDVSSHRQFERTPIKRLQTVVNFYQTIHSHRQFTDRVMQHYEKKERKHFFFCNVLVNTNQTELFVKFHVWLCIYVKWHESRKRLSSMCGNKNSKYENYVVLSVRAAWRRRELFYFTRDYFNFNKLGECFFFLSIFFLS